MGSSEMEGFMLKRGDLIKVFKKKFFCIKATTLVYMSDKGAQKASGQIELKGAVCFSTPLQSNEATPSFMWGVAPVSEPRTHFFECSSNDERKKWMAAVLECGATSYGTIDSFRWLYDHANAPKLDPKVCQVDAQGSGGKCKSQAYKNSYCILHYLLIAQQRDAPQWMPLAIAKQCPGCGVAFVKGAKVKKQACRSCAQIFCETCTANQIALPKLGYKEDVAVCPNCLGLERERRNFVVKDLQLLLKGQVMTKHGKGVSNKNRERFVQFNYETVSLDAKGVLHTKSMFLRDILKIQTGVEPKMLKVVSKSLKDVNCCFSITSPETEWPLEVGDPKTAEMWVRALKQASRFLCGREIEQGESKSP
jgi:hypothetical protein